MKRYDTAEALVQSHGTGTLLGAWEVRLVLGIRYIQHRTSPEGSAPCFLKDSISVDVQISR